MLSLVVLVGVHKYVHAGSSVVELNKVIELPLQMDVSFPTFTVG
jgi:hypothetical protein